MKYKQIYDLPEFMSFARSGQLLVVKFDDKFVAVDANWFDGDYELDVVGYTLSTESLLETGLITAEEASELYAAERERTRGSYQKAELGNLLRLIRKFPDEAAELLPLPTSFEQPLTAEEEAQKGREAELADLASQMKLVSKYPKDAKEFLSQA